MPDMTVFLEWLNTTLLRAMIAAFRPAIDFVLHGTSRFFWIYCVTGLLIAAFAYRRHREAERFGPTLFNRETWLSASALNDYAIVVISPVLQITLFSGLVLHWEPVSAFVASNLTALGVTGSVNDTTAIGLGVALTLSLFLVDDFLRWYAHYVFHRIPELWEFHKVHHSAEVLNFATADRHHPVEVLITASILAIGFGLVNGLFIGLFGDKLTVTNVAGANAFLFFFNLAGGVLRHSPFWVSFGPRIERWVISPAMHQIHHSNKPEHFDKNLGGSLSVWDRMAGTLHIPRGREVEGFGIGEESTDFRSLSVIYFRPFKAAFNVFSKRVNDTGSDAPANASPDAHQSSAR